MAYDSVRAQLDKLLGPERNGPLSTPPAPPLSYTDAAVCKGYLLGFCPHDLHIKHRSEPGSCARKHPPTARAAFEADRAAGRAAAHAARWRRDLLAEAKAIVDDEERRIRAHARRLQESYAVQGGLAGLMIRDFGTLKKLGMVGEHAKIRVLSEMEEDVVDDVEEEQKRPASPGTRASEQKDSRESENEDDDDDEEGGADAEEEEEEEEEDDDFGVISVIPASRSKKEDPDPLTPEKGDDEANKPAESARRDATSPAKATPLERSEGKKTSSPSKQSPTNGDAAEVHAHAPDADPKTDTADENQAAPTPAATEDKMEEFYKKGTGPDGLLMLTRKQSLRVCACCGGFISLVDAESRLLSHYGGKSHHSLVQLRQKVADLENEIALERRLGTELSPRGFERGRRAESDTNRSRGDERRPSHGGSRDRYRGRHDRDDAHDRYAGADRYAAPHHRRDEGWRPREPRYRGREEDARLHPRYAYDRKRYRSRSPTRNHRRHRHRY